MMNINMVKYFFLLLSLAALQAQAQRTPFEKYDVPTPALIEVMLDHVADFNCRLISNGPDQFFGQADSKGNLYGFGRFLRQDGTQIFGIFRNGKLIHGITITQNAATVGDQEFHSSYSLTTGTLEYVYQGGERKAYDTRSLSDYQFMSVSYSNGDQYMGELYQGKRHGLGIYYYANGSIWFGQYDNNIRSGFGCVFSTEDDMTIGTWQGEDQRRDIYVRMSKK